MASRLLLVEVVEEAMVGRGWVDVGGMLGRDELNEERGGWGESGRVGRGKVLKRRHRNSHSSGGVRRGSERRGQDQGKA